MKKNESENDEMNNPNCANCGQFNCMQSAPAAEPPRFCPMKNFPEIIEESVQEYNADPVKSSLAINSARVEGEGYLRWSRVEETVHFARKIGAKKVGIATCIGLLEESKVLAKILQENGFEPVSICCKAGAVDKTQIGLKEEEKILEEAFESMCNPVAQARILNEVGTDLNIMMGLCVGHDALFLKEAKAPTTVLVVKDRVTGHNPIAAIYLSHFYYRRVFSI
jgi:uncharacterized metal-binding protein